MQNLQKKKCFFYLSFEKLFQIYVEKGFDI